MTTAVQACAFLLVLQGLLTTLGKYVYVREKMPWDDAQSYCREFHTDLAPVVNEEEMRKLRKISGYVVSFWTGLVRNDTDTERWIWSGGGTASTTLWGRGQPVDVPNKDVGMMIDYMIYNTDRGYHNPFFCFNSVVVRDLANWEEALEHCRKRHSNLASVTSQTEMLLIHNQLDKNLFTEHVWLGLRFFPVGWRWIDKEHLTYEAWVGDERPSCPALRQKCGALKVIGWLPNEDADKSVIWGTNNTLVGVSLGKIDFWEDSVWEAYNCEQRLYFVCY